MQDATPPLAVGRYTFKSRLLVGTGKYPDFATMKRALAESGSDVITVAVRRANLEARGTGGSLLDHSGPSTSCCPIPLAASRPKTRSAPRISAANSAYPRW